MNLQMSVIHTWALPHNYWDIVFCITQSFIWKTLKWSKWRADLISSIFQMRKQTYWSKNNLPEVRSWLHTRASTHIPMPVQFLLQKLRQLTRAPTSALLFWNVKGKLEEILEKSQLLPVLYPQPQSHLGFTLSISQLGPLPSVNTAPPSRSPMQRKAVELGRLHSLLRSTSLAMSLNLSQCQMECHKYNPPHGAGVGMTWTYMEIGG